MFKNICTLFAFGILSLPSFSSEYRDGTYRGNFMDKGETQVTVQFKIKDDKFVDAKYRLLAYKQKNYLKDKNLKTIEDQYTALLKNLTGKNVETGLESLYYPEKIELAGATIRSSKVRSAIQDGLNRGAYKIEK